MVNGVQCLREMESVSAGNCLTTKTLSFRLVFLKKVICYSNDLFCKFLKIISFLNFSEIFFFLLISPIYLFSQIPTESYTEDSASIEQLNVPKGEVLKFTFENSKIFPGTWREVWV